MKASGFAMVYQKPSCPSRLHGEEQECILICCLVVTRRARGPGAGRDRACLLASRGSAWRSRGGVRRERARSHHRPARDDRARSLGARDRAGPGRPHRHGPDDGGRVADGARADRPDRGGSAPRMAAMLGALPIQIAGRSLPESKRPRRSSEASSPLLTLRALGPQHAQPGRASAARRRARAARRRRRAPASGRVRGRPVAARAGRPESQFFERRFWSGRSKASSRSRSCCRASATRCRCRSSAPIAARSPSPPS